MLLRFLEKFLTCMIFFFLLLGGLSAYQGVKASTQSIPYLEYREFNVSGYLLVSPVADTSGKHPMMLLPPNTFLRILVPADSGAHFNQNGG